MENAVETKKKKNRRQKLNIPYHVHLKSQYWRDVTEIVKKRDGGRCRLCNSRSSLQVHHRTYDHIGVEMEHLDDLTTLCAYCHNAFHEIAKKKIVDRNYEMTLVDDKISKRIMYCSDSFKWMQANGINPKSSGWKKRCIGKMFPVVWIYGFSPKE